MQCKKKNLYELCMKSLVNLNHYNIYIKHGAIRQAFNKNKCTAVASTSYDELALILLPKKGGGAYM